MKNIILINRQPGFRPILIFDDNVIKMKVYSHIYNKYRCVDYNHYVYHVISADSTSTNPDLYIRIHPLQMLHLLLLEYNDDYIIKLNESYKYYESYAVPNAMGGSFEFATDVKQLYTKISSGEFVPFKLYMMHNQNI